jgi:catechol 2,3-dioxygenase-like lactoylglutathione lyase family enzyme
MKITDVTVGLTVSDLTSARAWYERALELEVPDLEPVDGVAEYKLLPGAWLQLGEGEVTVSSTALRVEVDDVDAEFARLTELGLVVEDIIRIPSVIDFFEFRDPDGNLLSLYSLR